MVDNTLARHIRHARRLSDLLESLRREYEQERKAIIDELQARHVDEFDAGATLAKVSTFATTRFDARTFKADAPRIYQKYLLTGEQTRLTLSEAKK